MKNKFQTTEEKYRFLLENWEKYSNDELGEMMGTSANGVAQLAKAARKKGYKLIKKSKTSVWDKLKAREGGDK